MNGFNELVGSAAQAWHSGDMPTSRPQSIVEGLPSPAFNPFLSMDSVAVQLREHNETPRCTDCIFSELRTTITGHLWWKKTKHEWRCSQRRWEPVTGVLIGWGSAEEMRGVGAECGPEGKLFQTKHRTYPKSVDGK